MGKADANEIFTPKIVISVFRHLKTVHSPAELKKIPLFKQAWKSPKFRADWKALAEVDFAANIAANVIIDYLVEETETPAVFGGDKYQYKSVLISAKNAAMGTAAYATGNLVAVGRVAVTDAIEHGFILADSWMDTVKELDKLPPKDNLPPSAQEEAKWLYKAKDELDNFRRAKKQIGAQVKSFISNVKAGAGELSRTTRNILDSSTVSTPMAIQPQQAAAKQIDLDNVYMKQASDLLVSSNVGFAESFSGTVTELSPSSPTTSTIWFTSHTGSRAGVLPGSYTGVASGTTDYTTPVTPLNGVAFTGTMTGHVVGYQGVQTKGNATYEWAVAGGSSGTLSGNIILKPGGGSETTLGTGMLTGPVKNNAGTTIGTSTVSLHNTAN